MLRYLSDTCVSGVLGAFAIIGERADADNVYNQDQVPARSQNVTLPNQQNSNSRAELMHRCTLCRPLLFTAGEMQNSAEVCRGQDPFVAHIGSLPLAACAGPASQRSMFHSRATARSLDLRSMRALIVAMISAIRCAISRLTWRALSISRHAGRLLNASLDISRVASDIRRAASATRRILSRTGSRGIRNLPVRANSIRSSTKTIA